jgi:histidine phosphotransferase ChpT
MVGSRRAGVESEAALAELLCARLCHDLAGAVGAVTAGAELLAEEGAASPMAAEALDLMASSAASLAARLRFLRLAVGPGNQGAAAQARPLAEAYFAKGHPTGEWRLDWPHDPAALSSDQAKLLLNLICLAQECLPRGGTIEVCPNQPDMVVARGTGIILGEAIQGLRAPDPAGLSPRAAQGAYTALLARRMGSSIDVRQGDAILTLAVNRKIPI